MISMALGKRQWEIEVAGVGKLNVYSINVDGKSFPLVTPDGKPVKGKRTGTSKTVYVDEDGKEWDKKELGYMINDRFIQKVEKTDKIKNYKIVDKTEYVGNYLSDSYYVAIPSDEETMIQLKEKGLYDDKAMEFTLKKSSVGMSFHRAVLSCFKGVLFMDSSTKPAFKSKIAQQVLEEMEQKSALMKALAETNEIVVKASEIEVEI